MNKSVYQKQLFQWYNNESDCFPLPMYSGLQKRKSCTKLLEFEKLIGA